jgi:hypothetical protein
MVVVMVSVNSPEAQGPDPSLPLSKVDRTDPALLHLQVAAEIRRAIADGEARQGERIPDLPPYAANSREP